jgi:hypothetical protein
MDCISLEALGASLLMPGQVDRGLHFRVIPTAAILQTTRSPGPLNPLTTAAQLKIARICIEYVLFRWECNIYPHATAANLFKHRY